jgi:hypothetical protein
MKLIYGSDEATALQILEENRIPVFREKNLQGREKRVQYSILVSIFARDWNGAYLLTNQRK